MKNSPNAQIDTGLARATAVYRLLSSSPTQAWKESRSALKAHPKSERVQFVAGLALIARGKPSEARVHFANAIKLGTPEPDAYLNLSRISAEMGRVDQALDTLDRALGRFPDDLRVMMARVQVFQITGDAAGALGAVDAVLVAHPTSPDALSLRGILLAENGRLLDAIAALEGFLIDHPKHVVAMINLGRFYAFTNQPARGLDITERAFAVAPEMPAVVENLAIRKRESGDFVGAAQLFQRLIALSPDFAHSALRQMADIVPASELGALSKEIDRTAREARVPEQRAQLGFAQAAIAKREGDDQAFTKTLRRANQQIAKLRPYQAKDDAQLHSAIREQFRTEAPTAVTDPSLPAVPIFIMGLPRSGTTLLERMLSSAPDVVGLGEVALLNRRFSAGVAASTSITDGLSGLRAEYAEFQKIIGDCKWTVDKMPVNYMHLGWINKAFPEAKLILLRRDRKDSALSIYENYFDDIGQNFSFEETAILSRFEIFEDTIAAWRELGAEFLELSYEDLTGDPEGSLRKVSEYCGIPFDAAMLKPEGNQGSIRTASSVQARQGVNKDSVARWKKYPDLLPKVFKQ